MIIFVCALSILLIYCLYKSFTSYKICHNTIIGFVGTPGAGKTFIVTREAVRAYKKQRRAHRWYKWCIFYRFFNPQGKYPATLYSNIPIRIGRNKYNRQLTVDHLLRRELIPMKAVVVIDEIGQFASQWDYDNPLVKEQIADFTRFFRHWIDGRLFITDQASDNIVKPIRCRLGMIYHLNDFHRSFGILPTFEVDVTPLLCVEDNNTAIHIEDETDRFFFGFLPYKWMKGLRRYDSRCYSRIYIEGATREPEPIDKALKTRQLIDISCSYAVSKDYKVNRQKYKEQIYTSMEKLKEMNEKEVKKDEKTDDRP